MIQVYTHLVYKNAMFCYCFKGCTLITIFFAKQKLLIIFLYSSPILILENNNIDNKGRLGVKRNI